MKLITIVLPTVLLVLLFSSCVFQEDDAMSSFLTAKDGVKIAYDFWQGNKQGVLLVHQLPVNKESWSAFVPELTTKGYSVLAIDYRGRGESGGQLQSVQDFQNIALDVDVAIDFLKEKGIKNVFIIGASIGANHALLAGVHRSEVSAVVLLSPGLDYRGVKTELFATQFTKPVLIVASEDDKYSAMSAKKLYALAKGMKELKMFDTAGHGTDMFVEKELGSLILSFLEKYS
ncbi:MAG: alpha/beta fold hydrolase [Candidatus Woesearchaeota archaeon]|nr:alpha/beta fold hydrolase [Candidatus Woesearchaeota archaeon]